MYILALESTGPHASVAVIDEKGKVTELNNEGTLNHLENLMPMARELLDGAGIALSDITAIAASAGPGSFTGIRIGVTTVRALAQTLGIPAISVETLKSFAYGAKDFDGVICSCIDARRNQCYAGAFKWEDGKLIEKIPSGPYMIDEFLEMAAGLGENTIFFGDGLGRYGEKIYALENVSAAGPDERLQHGSYVAKMALDIYNEGGMIDYAALEPIYMRKAEAERKREERLKNESAGN